VLRFKVTIVVAMKEAALAIREANAGGETGEARSGGEGPPKPDSGGDAKQRGGAKPRLRIRITNSETRH
jgi:hypothetical protein